MRDDEIIYFDLDGVCADFDKNYVELTGAQFPNDESLTEEETDYKWSLLHPHPTFFLDLPWVPGARTMVAHTMKHSKQGVGALSAASRRIPESTSQKGEWCKRELPWMPREKVIIVPSKYDKIKYVGPKNVLVDDYDLNIENWRKAGGIGILFKNSIQALHELQVVLQSPLSMFNRTLKILELEMANGKC